MRAIYILLPLLINICSVSAQKTWSLEDCIAYAHSHNLTIAQQEHVANSAANTYRQSRMEVLPNLNFSANRNYNFGYQVDQYTNNFIDNRTLSDSYRLSSSISLFQGMRIYNLMKSSEYTMLASIQNVEKEKINISIEIAMAYLQVLFNNELTAVAYKQRELTQLQVDRTAQLVDVGNAAKGELLEINAQLAAEDLNIINSNNNYRLSLLNLAQLLDLQDVDSFKVFIPDTLIADTAALIPNAFTVYNEATNILPHIKEAQFNVKSKERSLKYSQGSLYPSLSLSADINTGYSDNRTKTIGTGVSSNPIGFLQSNPNESVLGFTALTEQYKYFDQISDNTASSVFFSLNVPIFNRLQNKTNISNARVNLDIAETSLRQVEQALLKEIQQARNDATSAREKYKSAITATTSYQEAFNYTKQKHAVGMVNNVEYNIASNNLLLAKSDMVQAKYEYIFSLKILDFYRGRALQLGN